MSPQIGLPHDFVASAIKPTSAVTSWNCWATATDERTVTNPAAIARHETAFLRLNETRHNFRRAQIEASVTDANRRVFQKGFRSAIRALPTPGKSMCGSSTPRSAFRRFRVILIDLTSICASEPVFRGFSCRNCRVSISLASVKHVSHHLSPRKLDVRLRHAVQQL